MSILDIILNKFEMRGVECESEAIAFKSPNEMRGSE